MAVLVRVSGFVLGERKGEMSIVGKGEGVEVIVGGCGGGAGWGLVMWFLV